MAYGKWRVRLFELTLEVLNRPSSHWLNVDNYGTVHVISLRQPARKDPRCRANPTLNYWTRTHPRPLKSGLPKRGRPALAAPKEHVNIRVDADIVGAFKQTGTGWQPRLANALRDWLKTHPKVNGV